MTIKNQKMFESVFNSFKALNMSTSCNVQAMLSFNISSRSRREKPHFRTKELSCCNMA